MKRFLSNLMKRLLSILWGFLYRSLFILFVGLLMILLSNLHLWPYVFHHWEDFLPMGYFIFPGALLQTVLAEFLSDKNKKRTNT